MLDDILAGRAPNAGRFCGYCYHPLSAEREVCPHCDCATADRRPVEGLPRALVEMHRLRRKREGTVVRSFAWGGLTTGVIVSLLPFVIGGRVTVLTAGLFLGLLVFFYLFSANLANSVGDALGYRWGQSTIRRRWEKLVAERDGPGGAETRPGLPPDASRPT